MHYFYAQMRSFLDYVEVFLKDRTIQHTVTKLVLTPSCPDSADEIIFIHSAKGIIFNFERRLLKTLISSLSLNLSAIKQIRPAWV